jgi:hypothetical protein
MSKGVHDIVSFVVFWELIDNQKHIIIKLFKTTNISRQFLTQILIELLEKYSVKNQTIFYVKTRHLI